MNELDNPEMSQELNFFADCTEAISNQEYARALELMNEGLHGLLENGTQIDARNLKVGIFTVLLHLQSRLQEAYGERWEERAEIPHISENTEELGCSFCGKKRHEVIKLIAGPNVYICNECVHICNQILE